MSILTGVIGGLVGGIVVSLAGLLVGMLLYAEGERNVTEREEQYAEPIDEL